MGEARQPGKWPSCPSGWLGKPGPDPLSGVRPNAVGWPEMAHREGGPQEPVQIAIFWAPQSAEALLKPPPLLISPPQERSGSQGAMLHRAGQSGARPPCQEWPTPFQEWPEPVKVLGPPVAEALLKPQICQPNRRSQTPLPEEWPDGQDSGPAVRGQARQKWSMRTSRGRSPSLSPRQGPSQRVEAALAQPRPHRGPPQHDSATKLDNAPLFTHR